MTQNLNNLALHRDYGATSSTSTSAITRIPDVNFSGLKPMELDFLSDNIGFNIISVSSSWRLLDKALNVIGKPRDTQASRDKLHQLQLQTNILIQTTTKDLQRLKVAMRHADKQQNLKQEKLTNEFRQVVKKYSETQKKLAAAMKQVDLISVQTKQQDEESAGIKEEQEIQIKRQMNSEASLLFEHDMMLEQEKRIKQIEADVLDINAIFLALSILVNEQGEQVELVGNSISVVDAAVTEGAAELRKAVKSTASYGKKMLILLAIAVIIGLIVIGIIVGK